TQSHPHPSGPTPCPRPRLSASPIFTASPDLWTGESPSQGYAPSPGLSPQSPLSCCSQGRNSGSELGKVWNKVFRVIRIPSASHFDFYCGTCAVLGSSLTLQGSSLGDNMDQHPIVFGNASNQGSWRQLLWLLQLPDLAWTQEALSEEMSEDGPVP
uniref:beta-D-galactosyl-(1->3)-N-acetyl-beta-D-galactosaminide alpha-2,3-sialyltransferase n=1 Tax=Otolemur garnettii TaxID=30611 RepID=H0XIK4_OTOGA